MGRLVLNSISYINRDLIISTSEIEDIFLPGISLKQSNGEEISNEAKYNIIRSAQSILEKMLGIRIMKQVISESRSYQLADFNKFLLLKVSFPVRKSMDLEGFLGETKQINYPQQWLSIKHSNTGQRYRHIALIPNGAGYANYIQQIVNYFPLSVSSYQRIPYYWKVTYLTGYDSNEIDPLILQAIGKIAAIDFLNIASNFIIGPGLTGTNLSLDGLSQSIQSAKSSSSGAFGPTIAQYLSDLKDNILPTLKGYYRGILMTSA